MYEKSEEIKGMKLETITLKPHDRSLFRDLFDVRAMCARAANGRHEGLAGMEGANTAPLGALNHKEYA